MWIALGVGGALVLICCLGGLFGFGALVVASRNAVNNEAKTVVSDYLAGLRDADYSKAYDQLCAAVRRDQSLSDFTNTQQGRPRVRTYSVGNPSTSGTDVLVPANIQNVDGDIAFAQFRLVQDRQVGTFKICEISG